MEFIWLKNCRSYKMKAIDFDRKKRKLWKIHQSKREKQRHRSIEIENGMIDPLPSLCPSLFLFRIWPSKISLEDNNDDDDDDDLIVSLRWKESFFELGFRRRATRSSDIRDLRLENKQVLFIFFACLTTNKDNPMDLFHSLQRSFFSSSDYNIIIYFTMNQSIHPETRSNRDMMR